MKNTIKNMELLLEEMKRGFVEGEIQSVKTLADTYLTLFKSVCNKYYDNPSTKRHLHTLHFHKKVLETIAKRGDMELANSIVDGQHRDARDIAIILERANKAIRDIGYLFPTTKVDIEKEFPVEQCIQDLLNTSIEAGTLVAFHDESHRGMGKTTALIKKTHDLGCVLIAGNDLHARVAREAANEMGLHGLAIASFRDINSLSKYHAILEEKGFLIDEMVSNEVLSKMKNYKLLGGFSRIVV